ncbi:MAG: class I SAM-dependent methyltransferase [Filomicrobium sp.]
MTYDAAKAWTKLYSGKSDMAYPAEGVIRIFKGRFPDLKMPGPAARQSVIDVGCGDGRHLPLFHSLGMEIAAVEISDEIVSVLKERMNALAIPVDIRAGTAGSLPFQDESFDYLLTWNSCYYMSATQLNFMAHVAEMARVIRPGGWIVASIPKKTSFVFQGSTAHEKPGYRIIGDEFFGGRNGEVMRCMADRKDLETSFSGQFEDFCHADLDMDWFGLAYHWHVFAARRRNIV